MIHNRELIELYKSGNLLQLLKTYTYNNDLQLIKELEKDFYSMERDSVKYNNGQTILYLKDTLGVRLYEIKGYKHGPSFFIKKHFDTLNKKDLSEILKIFPLVISEIIINQGRVFYKSKASCSELRLWTIIAETCKHNLWKQGLYNNDEKQLIFNNRPSYYRDFCFFTSNNIDILDGWRFYPAKASLDCKDLHFSGSAEKKLFRQKYAEFDYEAKINIETGEIVMKKENYGSWDYK